MRNKYFIDHNNRIRQCGMCGHIKPFDDFDYTCSNKVYTKSQCKPCRSIYTNRRSNEKKLKLYPDLYNECDKCNHIWRKVYGNTCKRCTK